MKSAFDETIDYVVRGIGLGTIAIGIVIGVLYIGHSLNW